MDRDQVDYRMATRAQGQSAERATSNRARFPDIAAWADDYRALFGASIRVAGVWDLRTGETLYGQQLPRGGKASPWLPPDARPKRGRR